MTTAKIAPYGSWTSPITSDLIVAGTVGFGHLVLDGDDTYWSESRPTEGGRNVIVRRSPDGTVTDVTPAPYSARTRVHEMGGGAFFVHQGIVFFANDADQRLYRQDPGQDPRPLTADSAHRFADGLFDAHHNRIVIVLEDHSQGGREPVNLLVSLDPEDGESRMVLASGQDFYSSPRLSPDGSQLAWLSWSHPNMPWDGTELWVADLNPDGSVAKSRAVAGGPNESIFQPEWSPEGPLLFVSDRSGWWNLFRWDGEGDGRPLLPMEAEFGMPQWVFGMSTYAFESPDRLVCAYRWRGNWHLATLDADGQHLSVVRLPLSEYEQVRARPGRVVCLAASAFEFTALVEIDLETRQSTVLRRSSQLELDPGYLSAPEPVEYPSGGHTAHAYYYAPHNRDYRAPGQDKPPLIVRSHGGPTSSTDGRLNLSTQYWTSRGFGVLDVNYGGSTGYGRDYRQLLEGKWGIVDVDDCVNGARYLTRLGDADPNRLIIRGSSAGGYTTLAALTFRDVFKAGASYYGISDLEALEQDTHKFESRYTERLVGPYPQAVDTYRERSPIHGVDKLSCPIIFFQGLEDRIVPPNQAERMVEALRDKGLPVAYVPFEGEQHGFRRAENIKRALDNELYFYARVFGFELPEYTEPVAIENLP